MPKNYSISSCEVACSVFLTKTANWPACLPALWVDGGGDKDGGGERKRLRIAELAAMPVRNTLEVHRTFEIDLDR